MRALPTLPLSGLILLLLASPAARSVFKFNGTTSEVLQDDSDGGRIRGVRSRENKTFVLGGLFPIHTHSAGLGASPCGEVRQERGLERMEAMLFALDSINADPNLLPGVELGYDIRDTCNSETVGLDEAIDLIITASTLSIESCEALPAGSSGDGAAYAAVPTSGIVGAASSSVSVPVASLGRLFRMPQVSYSSTSPLLTDRSRYGFFRRTVPSDDLQVLAMVDILLRFGWNYVSILYSEDTYGSAGINEFVNVSDSNGICIDFRQGIPPAFSSAEYDTLVDGLANSSARVVVIFANQESVKEVLTRVNKNEKLSRNFTWIASDAWARSIELVHQFNETAAGLFGVAPFTEHLTGFDNYISQLTINSNTRNDWFPEFFAAFANCTLGEDCDNDASITSFSRYQQGNFIPLVVDAVYSFAHALHSFLVENCNETDSAPFLWFKENGTCLGQSRELNGSSLLEYLNDVNFTSVTNNSITFDESGSVQGFYEILNYQAVLSPDGSVSSYQFVSVGKWVGGNVGEQLTLNSNVELQFGLDRENHLRSEPLQSSCGGCGPGFFVREIPGSCCSICEPCLGKRYSSGHLAKQCDDCFESKSMWGNSPLTGSNSCVAIPEVTAMYSDPWAIPSLILGCVGLVCVIATAIIFGVFWKTPIVMSSGREQMILLLVGISCSFLLPFFYVAPPSIPICLVNRLGLWFCYSLMFGALAVKVQRVARIFYGIKRNLNYKPRFVSPFFQVLFTLIVVAAQMVLIVISLAVIHPKVTRLYPKELEDRLREPTAVVTCEPENIGVIVLSLLYETAIITVATVLGAFSFKFPENFNEAKYISFCSFALLVVWLGLIPTYFTTQSRPEVQNAAISLFIILSAFAVLFFIFGPKLFIMIFQPDRNSAQFSTHHTANNYDSGIKMQTLNKEGTFILIVQCTLPDTKSLCIPSLFSMCAYVCPLSLGGVFVKLTGVCVEYQPGRPTIAQKVITVPPPLSFLQVQHSPAPSQLSQKQRTELERKNTSSAKLSRNENTFKILFKRV